MGVQALRRAGEVTRRGYVIFDPVIGKRTLGRDEFSRAFTGVALELLPGSAFKRKRERARLDISDLIRFTPDVARGLVQALVLSVLLEGATLLGPYYMQLTRDEAIGKGDRDLLFGLTGGFAILWTFNTLMSLLRAFVLQYVANTLTFSIKAGCSTI